MTEQAKEARRAYKRQWAKDNPEKVKAQQARYWARQAEKRQQPQPQPAGEAEKNDL